MSGLNKMAMNEIKSFMGHIMHEIRRYLFNILILISLFTLCQINNLRAAEFTVLQQQNDRPAIIIVNGDLYEGDEKKFINTALSLVDAIVMLDSDGGNLIAGIEIGKAIKLKGFSSFVPNASRCSSACGLAWLGGRVRIMGSNALVGFHAAYTKEDGKVSSAANALVGAYLNQLGLSSSAVIYITSPQPDQMRYLTIADAQRVGIEVKELDFKPTGVSRPSGATPSSTTPNSSVSFKREQDTVQFITNYWQLLSDGYKNPADLTKLYNITVDYYGKSMYAPEILRDKQSFFKRWPNRLYQMNGTPTSISCDELTCYVYGEVSWTLSSYDRGSRSTGTGRYSFAVSWSTGRPLIMREVLDANVRKIEKFGSSSTSERKISLTTRHDNEENNPVIPKPNLLGNYGTWSAHANGANTTKTCWALSMPVKRIPYTRLKYTSAYIYISTRPAEGIKNEIAINLGYPTGSIQNALADIDGKRFELVTKGTNAWVRDREQEKTFVYYLRRSRILGVKAYSSRGTPTYDTYNLRNAGQAIDRALNECE